MEVGDPDDIIDISVTDWDSAVGDMDELFDDLVSVEFCIEPLDIEPVEHGVFGIEFIEPEGLSDEFGVVFLEIGARFAGSDEEVELFAGEGGPFFSGGDPKEFENELAGFLEEPGDWLDDKNEGSQESSHESEGGFWMLQGDVFGDELTEDDEGEGDDDEGDDGDGEFGQGFEARREESGEPLFEESTDTDSQQGDPDLDSGDASGLIFSDFQCNDIERVSALGVRFEPGDSARNDGVFCGDEESGEENQGQANDSRGEIDHLV